MRLMLRKNERGESIMIQVSKKEMEALRERFPFIRATRTVHKYYIEERAEYVAFLKHGPKKQENGHA